MEKEASEKVACLEQIMKFVGAPSGSDHLGLVGGHAGVTGAMMQVVRLDELDAVLHLGRLELHKMQLPCAQHMYTSN